MDTTVIDKTRQDFEDNTAQLEALAASDDFNPDDPTVKELETKVSRSRAKLETLTRAVSERNELAKIESALARTAKRSDEELKRAQSADQSLGEMFIRSNQFNDWTGYGQSSKLETRIQPEAMLHRAVTLPVKTTDLPSFLSPGWQGLAQPDRRFPLLDLIPTITTVMQSFPVAGIKVSEGGAAVVPEGDEKPPLDIVEDKVDVALEMVAVYTQVTRQVLALGDSAYIRNAIDTELRYAVLKKMEELAVAALTGATLPTAQAPQSGGTLQGAIRLGMATVQSAGYAPTAVAVNPADAANVDISMLDKSGACCTDGYWGLTVVPVPGLAAGTAYVGDFGSGMRTFSHSSGLSLLTTDSHADTFIKNVITILSEWLAKTVVTRADAFAKVSVSST